MPLVEGDEQRPWEDGYNLFEYGGRDSIHDIGGKARIHHIDIDNETDHLSITLIHK